MKNCIFCKIIAGEIPSTVVYENEDVLCIQDIAPMAPVHVLVLPKVHCANVLEGAEIPGLTEKLMKAAGEVARIKGIRDTGFRTVINTGSDAGQTVFHLHVHVLGGKMLGLNMG
jgi:histidine triad (HIT) family protein